MSVAIIPARGGSKRIPRKNIKRFGGKPMIAFAVAAAQASGLFKHIIVSTEDTEIAAVARDYGAETPFVRPVELADDYTSTATVMAHDIGVCQNLGLVSQYVCCIYPATPFIRPEDLSETLSLLKCSAADYCFPVTEFPSPVQRALKRLEDGKMLPLYPENESMRTQDLEPAYYDAGQFYWGKTSAWLKNPRIHSSGVGYLIPNWRVADIDTPDDWLRAEALYKVLLGNETTGEINGL